MEAEPKAVNIFKSIGNFFFGGSSDKSVIEQVADTVERFKPGPVKEHEMEVENVQLTNSSQDDARKMVLAAHGTWLDVVVDGYSRAIRPAISTWVACVLFGWVDTNYLDNISERGWYVILLVLGFWFGTRAIVKDIPSMIAQIRGK